MKEVSLVNITVGASCVRRRILSHCANLLQSCTRPCLQIGTAAELQYRLTPNCDLIADLQCGPKKRRLYDASTLASRLSRSRWLAFATATRCSWFYTLDVGAWTETNPTVTRSINIDPEKRPRDTTTWNKACDWEVPEHEKHNGHASCDFDLAAPASTPFWPFRREFPMMRGHENAICTMLSSVNSE